MAPPRIARYSAVQLFDDWKYLVNETVIKWPLQPKAPLVTKAPDLATRKVDATTNKHLTAGDTTPFRVETLGWAAAWAELAGGYSVRHLDARLGLLKVAPPGAETASFVIRWEPKGFLMAEQSNGWLRDIFFPSLESALLAICPLTEAQSKEASRRAAC